MKYNPPFLSDLGHERWRARFRYKEDGEWKETSKVFRAASKRAAKKIAAGIHDELEEQAERESLHPMLSLDEDENTLEAFLERFISGLEGSGSIQPTTAAGYRHSASHVCRYLGDLKLEELTPRAHHRHAEPPLE